MKTAIVHEWFDRPAGSEECVKSFMRVWKDADPYALVDFFSDEARAEYLQGKRAGVTFIQNLPFAEKRFRSYLPLFPLAIEQTDLSAYDVIISSSHAVAKGVISKVNQLHLCYCYSPMRYAWDLYHQYIAESDLQSGIQGLIAKYSLHRLRQWDYTTAARIDYFVGISKFIAARIKKTYGRQADYIYPPVDVDKFPCVSAKDDYYVAMSRLVPYKKMDLIAAAFSRMPEKKLLIIGEGPEKEKIKKIAGPNVELTGRLPLAEMKTCLQKARGFVFAAEEDFGIAVLEAMACGTPVIALNKGGASETVQHLQTGVHYPEQTVDSLTDGVKEFEKNIDVFDSAAIAKYAAGYSRPRFEAEIKRYVEDKMEKFF